jgi:hypothetical protein
MRKTTSWVASADPASVSLRAVVVMPVVIGLTGGFLSARSTAVLAHREA